MLPSFGAVDHLTKTRGRNINRHQQPTSVASVNATSSNISDSTANNSAARDFAQQAARASLATMMNTSAGAKKAPTSPGEQPLHCGKWTVEEEAYVQCLIEEFQAGYLPIREGTSLRSFLSKMLNCKPKRISKKFEGSDYNGKQVYVSQPYKLTADEARERRDRLCTLERKFHQSVAELKNAEAGGKPAYEESLDIAAAAIGGGAAASLPGAAGGRNMNMNMSMNSMNMNVNPMNTMSMNAMGQMSQMSSMNRAPSPSIHDVGVQGNMSSSSQQGPFQQQQFLEELAFQDSMMRLRQQQAQQAQQQQAAAAQQHAAAQQQQQGQGAGSYVDPILGSLSLGQNAVNTTPLAASQYWRRQALLEASTHLDSLRMAQAGAIGIQRPTLEPGALRDLRMPAHLGGGGMSQGGQFADHSESAAAAASLDASFHKKRGSDSANMSFQQQMMMKDNSGGMGSPGGNFNKRMRRDDISSEEFHMQQQQQNQLAGLHGGLNNNQFLR